MLMAVACPRLSYVSNSLTKDQKKVMKIYNLDALKSNVVPDRSLNATPCSGHGRCRSMREAAYEFNGL